MYEQKDMTEYAPDEYTIIERKRYEELLKKEVSYDMKKKELTESSFVSDTDKMLFGLKED